MKSFIVLRTILSFAFLSLFITACGGGGGGGGSSDPYSLSSNSVSFDAAEGGSAPASQVVTVTVNSGTVFVDVVESSAYFSTSFTLTGPTTGDITITPTSPTMAPGQYNGSITVYGCSDSLCNAQVAGSPKTINVTYTVTALNVSPTFLNFSLLEGTATDLQTVDFDFTGSASGWNASVAPGTGTPNWWSLSATSGISLPAQIGVTADATGIPVGVHTATLNISVNGATKPVTMTLVVNAQAVNFVSPYVATTNVAGDVIIRGHGFSSLTNPTVSFGAQSATSFSVISDSEIRATHPALTAANYNIDVSDATTTLTSNAVLVVKDAPAFSYEAIPLTNSTSRILFDEEREAIYTVDPTTDLVNRYTHNGTNWVLAGSWSTTGGSSFDCCSITISSDGATLYIVRNNLIYPVDLATNIRGAAFDAFPFSRSMGPVATVNDGSLLLGSSFNNYLFRYDTLTDGLIPISTSFRYANSHIIGSADGSRILTPYHGLGTTTEPLTYYDASSASLVSNSLQTSNLNTGSIDRTGTRSILWHDGAIDEHRVYDQNFNVLGSLPPLDGVSVLAGIASVISPDGNRAYTYNNSTGMLRVLDLNSSDGSGGFTEIGTGTMLADSAGANPKMIVSLDGGTIIIAGNDNIIVTPAP